jgi:hypothetical protein
MFQKPRSIFVSGVQGRKTSGAPLVATMGRAQVQFRLDRPPGRDRQALQIGEPFGQQAVKVVGNGMAGHMPRLDRHGGTFGQQALAFGGAPAGNIAGLFGVDKGRIKFSRKAG